MPFLRLPHRLLMAKSSKSLTARFKPQPRSQPQSLRSPTARSRLLPPHLLLHQSPRSPTARSKPQPRSQPQSPRSPMARSRFLPLSQSQPVLSHQCLTAPSPLQPQQLPSLVPLLSCRGARTSPWVPSVPLLVSPCCKKHTHRNFDYTVHVVIAEDDSWILGRVVSFFLMYTIGGGR